MHSQPPVSFIDRGAPNPMFRGFESSNIVEAKIKEIHTDEANNVNFTATVVTIENEVKHRLPFLFPWASADGTAGLFVVPNVGDQCLVAMAAGNNGYIIGYHPSVQVQEGRASAALMSSQVTSEGATQQNSQSLAGTFAKSQLLAGSIELKAARGNRILLHPGGPISIDAKLDLFTFYDSTSSTIESMCRSMQLMTAGGSVLWEEGHETTKTSMKFQAEMYTKSATEQNFSAGPTRGGAKLTLLFSEDANYFLLGIEDKNGIKSKIAIGPTGIILSSGNGVTQGSIAIGPTGNFALSAGNPNSIHTQLDLAPEAIAITALNGPQPLATVQALADGSVNVSGLGTVTVESEAGIVIDSKGGAIEIIAPAQVGLGALGGLGVVREFLDEIIIFGVTSGPTSASGFAVGGSSIVTAAG